jgi:hypothetical protein
MSTGRMTPFGGGVLGPDSEGRNRGPGSCPCGGIVELFEIVLTLDDVSHLSNIELLALFFNIFPNNLLLRMIYNISIYILY